MNGEVISAQIDIMEAGTTMINRYYPVNVKTGNTSTTYYKLGEDLTGKYNKDTYFISTSEVKDQISDISKSVAKVPADGVYVYEYHTLTFKSDANYGVFTGNASSIKQYYIDGATSVTGPNLTVKNDKLEFNSWYSAIEKPVKNDAIYTAVYNVKASSLPSGWQFKSGKSEILIGPKDNNGKVWTIGDFLTENSNETAYFFSTSNTADTVDANDINTMRSMSTAELLKNGGKVSTYYNVTISGTKTDLDGTAWRLSGSKITVPEYEGSVAEGQAFDKWTVNVGGSSSDYTAGQTISIDKSMSITFEAKFKETFKTYQVSINGGVSFQVQSNKTWGEYSSYFGNGTSGALDDDANWKITINGVEIDASTPVGELSQTAITQEAKVTWQISGDTHGASLSKNSEWVMTGKIPTTPTVTGLIGTGYKLSDWTSSGTGVGVITKPTTYTAQCDQIIGMDISDKNHFYFEYNGKIQALYMGSAYLTWQQYQETSAPNGYNKLTDDIAKALTQLKPDMEKKLSSWIYYWYSNRITGSYAQYDSVYWTTTEGHSLQIEHALKPSYGTGGVVPTWTDKNNFPKPEEMVNQEGNAPDIFFNENDAEANKNGTTNVSAIYWK